MKKPIVAFIISILFVSTVFAANVQVNGEKVYVYARNAAYFTPVEGRFGRDYFFIMFIDDPDFNLSLNALSATKNLVDFNDRNPTAKFTTSDVVEFNRRHIGYSGKTYKSGTTILRLIVRKRAFFVKGIYPDIYKQLVDDYNDWAR